MVNGQLGALREILKGTQGLSTLAIRFRPDGTKKEVGSQKSHRDVIPLPGSKDPGFW